MTIWHGFTVKIYNASSFSDTVFIIIYRIFTSTITLLDMGIVPRRERALWMAHLVLRRTRAKGHQDARVVGMTGSCCLIIDKCLKQDSNCWALTRNLTAFDHWYIYERERESSACETYGLVCRKLTVSLMGASWPFAHGEEISGTEVTTINWVSGSGIWRIEAAVSLSFSISNTCWASLDHLKHPGVILIRALREGAEIPDKPAEEIGKPQKTANWGGA